MDVPKLIRSDVVPAVLLLLLIAGVFAISRHWPTTEGDAAKVQAIAGIIGLVAAIIVAVMTWAYVRTTHQMMEVQQAALDQQRPRVEGRVVRAQCVIDGPNADRTRVNFSLTARVDFRNLSILTPTTLRIVTGGLDDAPAQRFDRAYFDEMQTTHTPDTYPLTAGQAIALNVTVKISFPNEREAVPDSAIFQALL
jgi:predicted outer membrane protein